MLLDLPPPQSIAIIMDGNGRWAKRRGLPRLSGHQRGAQTLKDIVKACPDLGIRYLTVYAFSSENWRRPEQEISGLMSLLQHYLTTEANTLHESNVCLKVIGEREKLPRSIQELVLKVEDLTRQNKGLCLQVALSYGSRTEILQAAQCLAKKVKSGELAPEDITEDVFSQHLYTSGTPDPELLIRTSGEQRVSNYLLWQMAYTEFVFSEKLWPDFTPADLKKALDIYRGRERRFGYAA